jgi:hypothetical protein
MGGKAILTFTSTPALVGKGTAITNAKTNVPKNNLFILLPPFCCHVLSKFNRRDHTKYQDITRKYDFDESLCVLHGFMSSPLFGHYLLPVIFLPFGDLCPSQ